MHSKTRFSLSSHSGRLNSFPSGSSVAEISAPPNQARTDIDHFRLEQISSESHIQKIETEKRGNIDALN